MDYYTDSPSRCQKRKELIIELLIGLGMCLRAFAVFTSVVGDIHASSLDYIVQGHRGNIIRGIGCWPTYYITPLALPFSLFVRVSSL